MQWSKFLAKVSKLFTFYSDRNKKFFKVPSDIIVGHLAIWPIGQAIAMFLVYSGFYEKISTIINSF